jgi:hypothetical protein
MAKKVKSPTDTAEKLAKELKRANVLEQKEYDISRKWLNLEERKFKIEPKLINGFDRLFKNLDKFNKLQERSLKLTPNSKILNKVQGSTEAPVESTGESYINDVVKKVLEEENKQTDDLSKVADRIEKTNNTLKSLVTTTLSISVLKRVPSQLSAALELLTFGFLFLLKPLADLLAVILMPIAKYVVKFAFWLNQQSDFTRKLVGLVQLILIGILAFAGLLGEKAKGVAGKIAEGVVDLSKWLWKWLGRHVVGGIIDIGKWFFDNIVLKAFDLGSWLLKVLNKVVKDTTGFDPLEWITSHIKGAQRTIDEILERFIKPASESVFDFLDKYIIKKPLSILEFLDNYVKEKSVSLLEFIEKHIKGDAEWEEIFAPVKKAINGITEIIDNKLGGAITKLTKLLDEGGIGAVISKFLGHFSAGGMFGKAIGLVLEGFGAVLKAGTTSLIGYIISSIVGWIADHMPDGIMKQVLYLISDIAFLLGRALDLPSMIWDVLQDLYIGLTTGDWSFKNILRTFQGVGLDLINVFIDLYNALAEVAAKFGIHIEKQDRIYTLLGDTEGQVMTQTEYANKVTEAEKQTADKADDAPSWFDNILSSLKNINSKYDEMGKLVNDTRSETQRKSDTAREANAYRDSNPYGSYKDPNGKTVIRTEGSRRMAAGGIVTSPIHALIGEAGKEAVIPLNKLDQYIGKSVSSGGNQPVNISFSGIVDESKFRTIIKEEANKIFNSYKRINGTAW